MFDQAVEPAAPLSLLRALTADLDALSVPLEGVFLAIGDQLAAALGVLHSLESDFGTLSSGLDSDIARQSEQAFGDSIAQCGTLSGTSAQTAQRLTQVATAIGRSTPPLSLLKKILDEVRALAINARIQAAQISGASVDFGVFTNEMTRLHRIADEVVSEAGAQLDRLGASIVSAQQAEDDFRREGAGELDKVRARLERGLRALAERRQRSKAAMQAIGARSRRIAQRVAECISQMQINDLTRQRLEHVRQALDVALSVHAGGEDAPGWVVDRDDGQRLALASAVCRLQSEQLLRAAEEFAAEVGRMKANLQALAEDAAQTMREASDLFAGDGGEGSFLHDLQRDVDDASGILAAYATANSRVRDAIMSVMDGFAVVAGHIATIHSIDADMRVMGLNASLRCSRLGGKGRALGVVAQELRGCSRRTQESSETLSAAIASARGDARLLSDWVSESQGLAASLQAGIQTSMHALTELGQDVGQSLSQLVSDCAQLSTALGDTAAGIGIHGHLKAEAARISSALTDAADLLARGGATYQGLDDDVHRLLEKHYTMASERAVHGVAEDGCPGAADDCDAFFL